MVKLFSKFDSAFDCEVTKESLKVAIRNELYNSFAVKGEENTNAMMKYLIDNFFWEFYHHFEDELAIRLQEKNGVMGGEL